MIPTACALISRRVAIVRELSSLTSSSLILIPLGNFWNLIRFGHLLRARGNSLGQDWSNSRQIQNRSLRCYENLIQKFHITTTSKGMQNIQVPPGEGSFKDLCFGLRHRFPKFHCKCISFQMHFFSLHCPS